MNATRQRVLRTAGRTQSGLARQSAPRRFAHDEHGHGHEHSPPKQEPLGTTFYTVGALIPACYLLFYFASPGADNEPSPLTKIMAKYSDYQEQNTVRNALHTRAVEQAGHDKNLFRNSKESGAFEMRFPETFGVGSPISVPAGSRVDLSKVAEKYRREANADEEAKLVRLREQKQ